MRRVTVTIPDELEQDLVAYQQSQGARPSLTAIVQAALRHFLDQQDPWKQRGYRPAPGPYRITPADPGSGRSDISVNHDRVAAETAVG